MSDVLDMKKYKRHMIRRFRWGYQPDCIHMDFLRKIYNRNLQIFLMYFNRNIRFKYLLKQIKTSAVSADVIILGGINMSFKKNYQDYLQPKVEDIERAGFVPKPTRGGAMYYIKDGVRYAVVVANRLGDEYMLIVENDRFKELGYPSIFLDDKTGRNMLVPCIQNGCKYIRTHNLLLPVWAGKHVDHINHNRFLCTGSNLRYSTPLENSMNSQGRCEIYVYPDIYKYTYGLKVDVCEKDKIAWLRGIGFEERGRTSKKITLVSNAVHDFMVDSYLAYRDTARELYKGTGMEDFVYDIENDFIKTTGLLIHYYILGDITEEEMHKMNLDFWRDRLDNAPAL